MKKIFQIVFTLGFIFSFTNYAVAQEPIGQLKIGDIKGESVDKGHDRWIPIHYIGETETNLGKLRKRPGRAKSNDLEFPGDLFIGLEQDGIFKDAIFAQEVLIQLKGESGRLQAKFSKIQLNVASEDELVGILEYQDGTDLILFKLGYTEIEWTYKRGRKKKSGNDIDEFNEIISQF